MNHLVGQQLAILEMFLIQWFAASVLKYTGFILGCNEYKVTLFAFVSERLNKNNCWWKNTFNYSIPETFPLYLSSLSSISQFFYNQTNLIFNLVLENLSTEADHPHLRLTSVQPISASYDPGPG